MIDKIYIINLDKRTDRLEHVEKNVIPFLPYPEKIQRFSAVDHTHYQKSEQRAAGCSLSHLKIWNDAISNNYRNILIIEDDFNWIVPKEKVHQAFTQIESIDYNVIQIAYNTKAPIVKTQHNNLYRCNFALTTSGYFINVDFSKTMIKSIEDSISNLMNTNTTIHQNAIDVIMTKFQNDDKWFLYSRLGNQIQDHSNITNTKTTGKWFAL